tara:strand:+ start:342 stop:509 length:168 start_codon:yes stop_codon:yes gene_type:complete
MFNNWEEVPDEDLFQDGELTNEQAMIKAWDNVFYGKYKLIRRRTNARSRYNKKVD